jgi:hypothetical protein
MVDDGTVVVVVVVVDEYGDDDSYSMRMMKRVIENSWRFYSNENCSGGSGFVAHTTFVHLVAHN